MIVPVGCGDPLPGSTVNASMLDFPRLRNRCGAEGATPAASTVPAGAGPLSSISHISYTVPCAGGGTLLIDTTPAFMLREKTPLAVPPASWAETVRASGAAMICWVMVGAGCGRNLVPTP